MRAKVAALLMCLAGAHAAHATGTGRDVVTWGEVKEIALTETPIKLRLFEDGSGLKRAWRQEGANLERGGPLVYHEAYFERSGYFGRASFRETGHGGAWIGVPNASDSARAWPFFAKKQVTIGESSTVIHGRAEIRYVLLTYEEADQAKRSCVGYSGIWERFMARGYLCAPRGSTLAATSANAMIRAIGYGDHLPPVDAHFPIGPPLQSVPVPSDDLKLCIASAAPTPRAPEICRCMLDRITTMSEREQLRIRADILDGRPVQTGSVAAQLAATCLREIADTLPK
jgi:hypothetical protein